MFTHQLPYSDSTLLRVNFSDYSVRHFFKTFERKYPEKIWNITLESIIQDLSRIHTSVSDLQKSSQVDELWHNNNYWIFKYDFRIAKSKESTKSSGNRIVAFLDLKNIHIDILLIYHKSNLPKNKSETKYIEDILKTEFTNYWNLIH